MVQYFAVFLILSFSDGSLGTTTSPQQQNTAKLKDLCQRSMLGFPGIPGSNGIPGVPGVPGPYGPQGREGVKGQIGDKGSKGMPGLRGERGREGPPGKSGPCGIKGMKGQQGPLGMKGERGAVGNPGRKGDKGDKGESAKASQASVVPQTNWKQCVWKSESTTDNGKIEDCMFNKLKSSNSALKVSFQGNMRVLGNYRCNRWYFKFNGNECSGPKTIEAVVYSHWPSGNPNLYYHRSFEGYCENIPQGVVRVELWVGKCSSFTLGNANTGWNSVSRIMIEEVSRPQSK